MVAEEMDPRKNLLHKKLSLWGRSEHASDLNGDKNAAAIKTGAWSKTGLLSLEEFKE